MRELGDERLSELVERYIEALGSDDVDAIVGMLAEDVAWSMPPLASWFRGIDDVADFLARWPMSGEFAGAAGHEANGQLTVAAYTGTRRPGYLPFASTSSRSRATGSRRSPPSSPARWKAATPSTTRASPTRPSTPRATCSSGSGCPAGCGSKTDAGARARLVSAVRQQAMSQNPTHAQPTPPFPVQEQDPPGREDAMQPPPITARTATSATAG